ncbi:hypothetical protein [Streptomyces sp. NPDC048603]|uniref:hypothetical protein n=1 Tax=Streptomyces sp. NPDC048603 TaxID=3365577 RepID=UPI003720354F
MRRRSSQTGLAGTVSAGRRPDGSTGTRPRARLRRWPVVVARALATLFLVGVIVQAVLAGRFVTGDVDLLKVHSAVGGSLSLLPVLMLLCSPALWRWSGGRPWYAAFPVLLLVLVGVQIGAGESRSVELHIPLGVGLFGLSVALVMWAYGYRRHLTTGGTGNAGDAGDAGDRDGGVPALRSVPAAREEAAR